MSECPRVAVVSDMHGNLPALRAVLADIDRRGPFDRLVAGGDLCLNGPDPAATLDLSVERATDTIKGNTDRDIVDRGMHDFDIGPRKRVSIEWCREQLGDERVATLDGLRFGVEIAAPDGRVLQVVHANPLDLDRAIYPEMSSDDLTALLTGCRADVLVIGHMHMPFRMRFKRTRIACVGSCGTTSDGDRRAVWGEFWWLEGSGWRGRIHRVAYDYGETILRMLDSRMPNARRRIRDLLRAGDD